MCTIIGIKLPPVMKKRGRPKGHELTVVGLPAKKGGGTNKKKLQPFLKLHTSIKEKGMDPNPGLQSCLK